MGIDWGEKRIGLSLGDTESRVATPLKVVKHFREVANTADDEMVDEIVLGVPYHLDKGSVGGNDDFKAFYEKLDRTFPVIHEVDERLTSKAADRLPGDKKTKADRDAVAAMLILQSFLDKEL